MSDLDTIDYGLVLDLSVELGNDYEDAKQPEHGSGAVKKATQADMDAFARG